MFTGQERDGELVPNADFFNARYFMGVLGNFTSPDPANAGADIYNPQSWNGYGYVLGNPLNGVDSSGMSRLIYDGSTNTLTLLPSNSLLDPTQTVEGELGVGFCAANNIDSKDTIGKLVDGTYPFLPVDADSPHHHSAAEDSTNGTLVPGGSSDWITSRGQTVRSITWRMLCSASRM
jgi:RHS repeat-associated protein